MPKRTYRKSTKKTMRRVRRTGRSRSKPRRQRSSPKKMRRPRRRSSAKKRKTTKRVNSAKKRKTTKRVKRVKRVKRGASNFCTQRRTARSCGSHPACNWRSKSRTCIRHKHERSGAVQYHGPVNRVRYDS